jgi:hypothetical protein
MGPVGKLPGPDGVKRWYVQPDDSQVETLTALVIALAGSLGWKCGARAWGKTADGYSHVYPVVAFPKRPPFQKIVGLDTTVPDSKVGWEPPKAHVLTAWLE